MKQSGKVLTKQGWSVPTPRNEMQGGGMPPGPDNGESDRKHNDLAFYRDWQRRHPTLAGWHRRAIHTRLGWWMVCRGWLRSAA